MMTTFNTSTDMEQATPTKPPEEDTRQIKIKKLKAKLKNEEHRLVLMKKIRQSQTRPIANQQQQQQQQLQAQQNNIQANINGASVNNTSSNLQNSAAKKLRQSSSSSIASDLFPLQRNQQSTTTQAQSSPHTALSASNRSLANSSSPSNPSSPYNRIPAHAHQRPKVNSLWNPPPQQARHPPPVGIAPPHVGNLSRQPITTPPNVVQAMMSNLTTQPSLLMNQFSAAAAAAAAAATGRRTLQQQQPQISHQASLSKAQSQFLMQKRQSFKPGTPKQHMEQTLLQQHQQSTSKPNVFSSSTNKRSSVGVASPHVGNLSRQPITTPPNVVQDIRNSISGQQSLLMNSNNLSAATAAVAAATNASASRRNQSMQQISSASFNKTQANQVLAQRKAAAKSAIQKQLEQALMQLPQKQTQLGIDFIPNANNIEFIYYVGLEACVDHLTNSDNVLETQPLEKPFECSTCGTDFTPSWSWKRSNPVCENCVGNHVKKSLRNAQSNRIKSALVKAAKQEQEAEQKMIAESANSVSSSAPTSSSSNANQHSLLQPVTHPQQQSRVNDSSQHNLWPRISGSPLTNVGNTNAMNRSSSVQQQPVNTNLLNNFPLASLASLIQMNPQLGTLASLITANNANAPGNNANQLTQVATLLMNQLGLNLYKR